MRVNLCVDACVTQWLRDPYDKPAGEKTGHRLNYLSCRNSLWCFTQPDNKLQLCKVQARRWRGREGEGGGRAERGGLSVRPLSFSFKGNCSWWEEGPSTLPVNCLQAKGAIKSKINGSDQPSHHRPLMDQHRETERVRERERGGGWGGGWSWHQLYKSEDGGCGVGAGVMSSIALGIWDRLLEISVVSDSE